MKSIILFILIVLALDSCKKSNSNNSSNISHFVTYETSTTYAAFHYIEYVGANGTMMYPDLLNGPFVSFRISPFKGPRLLHIFAEGNSSDADITVKIFVDSILVKESTSPIKATAEYFLN